MTAAVVHGVAEGATSGESGMARKTSEVSLKASLSWRTRAASVVSTEKRPHAFMHLLNLAANSRTVSLPCRSACQERRSELCCRSVYMAISKSRSQSNWARKAASSTGAPDNAAAVVAESTSA